VKEDGSNIKQIAQKPHWKENSVVIEASRQRQNFRLSNQVLKTSEQSAG
jgi:hypothetical protein